MQEALCSCGGTLIKSKKGLFCKKCGYSQKIDPNSRVDNCLTCANRYNCDGMKSCNSDRNRYQKM